MKQCAVCQRDYPDSVDVCPEDASPLQLTSELLPGTVIRGKYKILSRLGAGGMATVYRAVHIAFNEERAIKVVNDRFSGNVELSQRFRTEAIVTRKLRHPNAVFIEDLDVMDDGRPFMVMEFVAGPMLRDTIRDDAPLAPLRAIRIAKQAASALAAAHSVGITHRDIKPENILLVQGPEGETAKVLDFGIAKVQSELLGANATQINVTSPGVVIGTPAYMSPEQADPKPGVTIDGRADIYCLGTVLYEMLSGVLPFESDSPLGMLLHQINTPPREIDKALPRLSRYPELCGTVMRCLCKKPEQRFLSAEQLVEALSHAEVEASKTRTPSGIYKPDFTTTEAFKTLAVPPSPTPDYDSKSEKQGALDPKLEIAHVLFLDIVGYSRFQLNTQARVLQELQEVVMRTPEYMGATKDDLIALPTGDGMALSFFRNPEAPLRCALNISAMVRQNPRVQLRMGLHSGPVYRVRDIKDNINVAGGGINFAQRVMDCGDAGHILASGMIADLLTQHHSWESCMHELGVAEVKHGVKLRIFNVHTPDAGNPAVPEKLMNKVGMGAGSSSVAVLTPPPIQEERSTMKSGPVALTPAVMEQAARDLAAYIGPIAKLIVKRASLNCSSAKELYTVLAEEIDSLKERAKFMNSRPRNIL
jgi:serine/threonine protein kinase